MFQKNPYHTHRWMGLGALAMGLALGMAPASADAGLVNNGGTGAVVFGVASYGGGGVALPSYTSNNVTGRTDILTSPGGGYQTADLSIPNNVAQFGGALPGGAVWTGGTNGNGTFGTGFAASNGVATGFGLTDANPDSQGAASYLIASSTTTLTEFGGQTGTWGTALGIGGTLGSSGSAVAVSLRTFITDTAGVFGVGGTDLPQLVLAASGSDSGYNWVALGGVGGGSAAMLIDTGTNTYAGLAINNMGVITIPDGDVITITTTLTAIADPASIDMIYPDLSLIDQTGYTGDPLPGISFALSAPEPTSAALVLGAMSVLGLARRRR